MTLPSQERNALIWTYEFLTDLMDPKKTPGVPRKIRDRAHACLHHYPARFIVEKKWQKDVEERG